MRQISTTGAGSLADLLGDDPDAPAVIQQDSAWTAHAIAAAADDLADALTAAGVAEAGAVAAPLPSDVRAVAAPFGVWRSRRVYVPLNPRLTAEEIETLLDRVGAAATIDAHIRGDGLIEWAVQTRAGARRYGAATALVMHTSGTTGPPKPVQLRHDRIRDAIDSVVATFNKRDRKAPPNLIVFPLTLWSGIYSVCFALAVGAEIVLLEEWSPLAFVETVRRHEIKSVVLAPAMLADLVASDIDDLGPLRFVRNGTAALNTAHARRFYARFGVPVLNGYGQTELGGEVIGWNAADVREFATTKLGAVGRPHTSVVISIRDDADDDVGVGEIGELCVRSPFMTDSPDGDRLTEDGLLRTGDLARIDDDGFVWLAGRRSDMINRSGLKVFPDEVEDVLALHDGVAEAAVVGVPDARVGEVPWAFVVRRQGMPFDQDALESHCRHRLAAFKVPARFVAVDTLPRNDIGKVLRRELRVRAVEGELS